MTSEKLDAAIAEIIIPQEKSKSKGNSHKRKQWENRQNWRHCTIGKSCKLGYIKICPIAKMKAPKFRFSKSPLCDDCICNYGLASSWSFMVGVSYDCDSRRYKKYSYNCTGFRRELNRRFRRTVKGEIGNYSYYRKIFEYQWECV